MSRPPLSPFEGLLRSAYEAGHTRLRFEVDLAAHFDGKANAWFVASGEGPFLYGRTGQEALAHLVAKGRAVG